MLGKLLKYELKAVMPITLIVAAVHLIVTIVFRGAIFLVDYLPENGLSVMTMLSFLLLFIVTIVTTGVIYIVLSFKRFYSNNYGREGYLTFTLPVTENQIYWSKFIAAALICAISFIAIFISILIVAADENILEITTYTSDIANEFLETDNTVILLVTFATLVIEAITKVMAVISCIFCAVSIGQCFKSHPLVGSIGIAIGLNWTVGAFRSVVSTIPLMLMPFDYIEYMYLVNYALRGVIDIIAFVVFYVITIYLMKKKVNLK